MAKKIEMDSGHKIGIVLMIVFGIALAVVGIPIPVHVSPDTSATIIVYNNAIANSQVILALAKPYSMAIK